MAKVLIIVCIVFWVIAFFITGCVLAAYAGGESTLKQVLKPAKGVILGYIMYESRSGKWTSGDNNLVVHDDDEDSPLPAPNPSSPVPSPVPEPTPSPQPISSPEPSPEPKVEADDDGEEPTRRRKRSLEAYYGGDYSYSYYDYSYYSYYDYSYYSYYDYSYYSYYDYSYYSYYDYSYYSYDYSYYSYRSYYSTPSYSYTVYCNVSLVDGGDTGNAPERKWAPIVLVNHGLNDPSYSSLSTAKTKGAECVPGKTVNVWYDPNNVKRGRFYEPLPAGLLAGTLIVWIILILACIGGIGFGIFVNLKL